MKILRIPGRARAHLLGLGLTLTLTGLLLVACVWRTQHKVETVHKIDAHIVLDIRQIRQEGAAVENYVRGNTDQPPALNGAGDTSTPPPTATETDKPVSRAMQPGLSLMLAALDPSGSAWAADEPQITAEQRQAAIERRRERAPKVEEGLKHATLGENDRGYLTVLESATGDERKDLEALAKAENADRKLINRAQAQKISSDDPNKLMLVEVVSAEQIRAVLKPGQMFQAPRDKEFFEDFQKSDLGKQYPDAKPGQWLKKK